MSEIETEGDRMENLNPEIAPVNMEGLDCIDNTVLTICNYFRGNMKRYSGTPGAFAICRILS